MKKYLTSGALAIIACGFMTSCHETEIDYASQIEAKKATFAENFVKFYGEIDPNQDWGFGTTTRGISGITRSGNTGETYPATHEYKDANGNVIAGANMNHNEWGDPNAEFGGWIVPDPLTEGQKLRVKAYFQSKPEISYEDPMYRHFFVQQVYKGDPKTAGPNSTEKVVAADGSEYTSDNMNHLTVGEANSHINNFNAGTCSTSDVLNHEGKTQQDEITLMVNVDDTSCFGYHDSGSSNQSSASPNHNDKMALVAASVIDAWAEANKEALIASGEYGEAVDDKWHRSFMGFDLAIKEGAQAYDTNTDGTINYATYDQAPESPEYAWDGENVIKITTGEYETVEVGNEWSTWTVQRPVYKDEYKYIMKGNETIGWLTTNENFYIAADKVTLDQSYQVNGGPSDLNGIKNAVILKEFTVNGTKYQSVINLPKIQQLVNDGYLPVNSKSLQDWVQVGVSDGVYSDWIVTLTEAQRITTTGGTITTGQTTTDRYLRKHVLNHRWVFCEDLGQASNRKDFDYNDLVFDAKIIQEYAVTKIDNVETEVAQGSPYALITPLAAGGELSITVADKNVHEMFGLSDAVLINTIDPNTESDVRSSGVLYAPTDPGRIDCQQTATYPTDNIIDIPINVQIYNNALQILARKGEAPHKIAVTPGTRWAQERVDINEAQPGFADWVKNVNVGATFWSSSASPKRYPYMPTDEYLINDMTNLRLPDVKIDGETTTNYSVNLASNEVSLWFGEEQLYSGSAGVQISYATLFSGGVAEGSIIRIYGVSNSSWELNVSNINGSEAWSDQKSGNSALFGYVEFKLNASSAELLRNSSGMAINGNGLTVLCVSIDNTFVKNTSN